MLHICFFLWFSEVQLFNESFRYDNFHFFLAKITVKYFDSVEILICESTIHFDGAQKSGQ